MLISPHAPRVLVRDYGVAKQQDSSLNTTSSRPASHLSKQLGCESVCITQYNSGDGGPSALAGLGGGIWLRTALKGSGHVSEWVLPLNPNEREAACRERGYFAGAARDTKPRTS